MTKCFTSSKLCVKNLASDFLYFIKLFFRNVNERKIRDSKRKMILIVDEESRREKNARDKIVVMHFQNDDQSYKNR